MAEVHHKPAFENADATRQHQVIEAGINEFSKLGFENANINVIAKKAGISVGLMYKYFETKEDLFITCMDEVISTLEDTIAHILKSDDKILVRAEKLIRTIQANSREDARFSKLYNEITHLSSAADVKYYSKRIESVSANVYPVFLEEAKKAGDIRSDCDTRFFAFFFDTLLMMLQFSYTCDYYKERFKIYCGEDVFENDEMVVQELLKFLESAFTLERKDIVHKQSELRAQNIQ